VQTRDDSIIHSYAHAHLPAHGTALKVGDSAFPPFTRWKARLPTSIRLLASRLGLLIPHHVVASLENAFSAARIFFFDGFRVRRLRDAGSLRVRPRLSLQTSSCRPYKQEFPPRATFFLQATLSAAPVYCSGGMRRRRAVFSYFFAVGRKSEVLGLDLSGLATYRDLAAYMSCLSYSIVKTADVSSFEPFGGAWQFQIRKRAAPVVKSKSHSSGIVSKRKGNSFRFTSF